MAEDGVERYAETRALRGRQVERRKAMAELRNRLEIALAGRYTLDREIGRGGMAIVYLAYDLRNRRDVALKVLRPELAVTLGPERFLQEIQLAANLAHPHILPLHDSGDADGLLFYVMPYVRGESLRDRLEREGQLPLVDALAIGREVASALDYAHRAGVIHRDIKPENILLQEGQAVVSDFGIARAISAAGSRLTAVGSTVGTPDYMSPEQAAGAGAALDGRSDLYSLGCVLFEMLAGTPPAALTPPEGPAAGPLRPRDRLTELMALRPSLPPEVAGIVARLLEPRARDRFATGAEVAAALAAPKGIWTPRSVVARRRRRWGAGLLASSMLAIASVAGFPKPVLDHSGYLVMPFDHVGVGSISQLDGSDVEHLLNAAIGRWADLHAVTEMELRELRLRDGSQRPSLATALAYARDLRVGSLVRGEYRMLGDSIEVTAVMYDVARETVLRRKSVRVAVDRSDWGSKFDRLADSLLLESGAPTAAAGAIGTRVSTAWRAYVDGHSALADWDLDSAVRAFQTALKLDPDYARASLWLAQALEWNGADSTLWGGAAERAVAARDTLSRYEQLLGQGLVALATGQYPDACTRYRELIRRDPRDFAGWFGLGECQSRDRAVEPDNLSPSRWRFRSSYHSAIQAYYRALQVASAAHRVFRLTRLYDLFFTQTYRFRSGFVLAPDTEWYAAFPSLDHDTVAFVPHPRADLFRGRATPATTHAAVAHNVAVLRDLATSWVQAFPGSAEAHEALAMVLESTGDLPDTKPSEHSAIAMIRRARSLARASDQRLELAIMQVRLLTKLEDFAAARLLADSLLTWPAPDAASAEQLAGVSALTGHAHRTAQLLSQTAAEFTVENRDGKHVAVRPLSLARVAASLQAYATLAAPAESITALASRVSHLVDASIPPAERQGMREALLDHPRRLTYPLLGASAVLQGTPGGESYRRMLWALEQKDTTPVRATLDSLRSRWTKYRPGERAITGTHLMARLYLALGDTAAATELLEGSLDALPTLGLDLLKMDQAAALVRSMVLRAELAIRAGDRATARRWAAATVALWSGADNEQLRSTVDRMRQIAAIREP